MWTLSLRSSCLNLEAVFQLIPTCIQWFNLFVIKCQNRRKSVFHRRFKDNRQIATSSREMSFNQKRTCDSMAHRMLAILYFTMFIICFFFQMIYTDVKEIKRTVKRLKIHRKNISLSPTVTINQQTVGLEKPQELNKRKPLFVKSRVNCLIWWQVNQWNR